MRVKPFVHSLFIPWLFIWALCPLAAQAACDNLGTDFWICYPTTDYPDAVHVSGTAGTSGTVQVSSPAANLPFTIPAGGTATVSIYSNLISYNQNRVVCNGGVHVTASSPVAVESGFWGYDESDSSWAFPTPKLGTDYYLADHGGGTFGVVATQNGTTVTVTGSYPAVFSMNLGQTYFSMGSDVTGTRVQSNFPVGVFVEGFAAYP
ncbi:MAG TPA: hypothetical protein VJ873_06565, partial [bacterium]|nr:hypothetical protein [bacterium]